MRKDLQISVVTLFIIFLVTQVQAQYDGLVGYWSFDDSTAFDSSGYGNHGTINGDPDCISGVKGAAFEFDGIDDYILVTDSDWLDTDSTMTISLWIRPDSFAAGGSKFMCKWYSAPQQGDWYFSLSSKDSCGGSCISWYMYIANYKEFGYESTGPSDVSDYLQMWQWNHIAVTFDTGLVRSYYNGELISEKQSDLKYTSLVEYPTDDIYIGRYRTYREDYSFFGALDEIRIYERALSTSEIADLYDQIASIEPYEAVSPIPNAPELYQNFPNPFNPSTNISFMLPAPEQIKIEIYDIHGRKIKTLLDKSMPAGRHMIEFNGQNLPSGVYFYRITAGKYHQVRKMMLLK